MQKFAQNVWNDLNLNGFLVLEKVKHLFSFIKVKIWKMLLPKESSKIYILKI